jgi:hypothetical protein
LIKRKQHGEVERPSVFCQSNSDADDMLISVMTCRLIALAFLFICAGADAQVQSTRPATTQRTGPSAESLATHYSGPVKFNLRVLIIERAAVRDPNPITRAAAWRYRYGWPFGYGCGYGCYGGYAYRPYGCFGFYPFTGGATGLGWWGPAY